MGSIHPFRSAVVALCAAAAMFGITAVTDKGHGAGWADGTQAVANTAWILMLLLAAAALTFFVLGLVAIARRRAA
jgi:hypothetical protein